MKKYIIIKILLLFLCISCTSVEECKDNICLTTNIEKKGKEYQVNINFISKIDTLLQFRDEMFMVGCPNYLEKSWLFNSIKLNLNDLKYSQLLVENSKGDIRLFSHQFIKEGEDTIAEFPNCSEMDNFSLQIYKDKVTNYQFSISKLDDLRVKSSDKKIKLHLYLKNKDGGIIISSSNWIYL